MKKRKKKPLKLHRETLAKLDDNDLSKTKGGQVPYGAPLGYYGQVDPPTVTPYSTTAAGGTCSPPPAPPPKRTLYGN